jgi:purine catabolism regulator
LCQVTAEIVGRRSKVGGVRVRELLALTTFQDAELVAGESGADREVRWAHVVDMPDPAPWVGEGLLLLTTGYAWPTDAEQERSQLEALARRGLAAIGLAVPGYVAHFSEAARAHAGRLGLPLLEIPWNVPFARITEELHRAILTSQQTVISRSEEIHRALTRAASEGTTLAELAGRLGELIGRSITIEDPHGKLLGFHTIAAQDDPVRRETLARTASPAWLLSELERLGHLDRIRTSAEPVRLPALPHAELAARVVCPIRVGGELAGFVWIVEGDEPLSELDHRAAEHASLVAALQIAHQRELERVESRLGYASFLTLLEAPSATPQTLERAALLGFDPAIAYRVGIVQLEEPLPLGRDGVLRRESIVEALRRHLGAAGVERPMLGASLNRVPFLIPDGADLAAVEAALSAFDVRIVFGRVATGTGGVRAGYREALELLGYDGLGRMARYEDVLLPRVLVGDAAARDAFVRELFSGLESVKGGAALREAILRYAEGGFAFRRTATSLGIHPNTLRYRLERAAAITGLAFDDADTRFRLQLAARLLRLASAPPVAAMPSASGHQNKLRRET